MYLVGPRPEVGQGQLLPVHLLLSTAQPPPLPRVPAGSRGSAASPRSLAAAHQDSAASPRSLAAAHRRNYLKSRSVSACLLSLCALAVQHLPCQGLGFSTGKGHDNLREGTLPETQMALLSFCRLRREARCPTFRIVVTAHTYTERSLCTGPCLHILFTLVELILTQIL